MPSRRSGGADMSLTPEEEAMVGEECGCGGEGPVCHIGRWTPDEIREEEHQLLLRDEMNVGEDYEGEGSHDD